MINDSPKSLALIATLTLCQPVTAWAAQSQFNYESAYFNVNDGAWYCPSNN